MTLRKYHKIQELKCKYITFAGITRYFTTSDTVNTFLMTVKLCSKFRAASSESVAKFTWILWVSSPIFSGVVLFSQSETIFNLKRMNLSIIYTFFLFFFAVAAFICEGNKDCLNGGYCVPPQNMNGPNDHNCWCPKGYSGRRCEISKCFRNLGWPKHHWLYSYHIFFKCLQNARVWLSVSQTWLFCCNSRD